MLRQKMESYPSIIGELAQNKDDNKESEDSECGGRLVHKSTCCCILGSWLLLRVPPWGIFEKLEKLKLVNT